MEKEELLISVLKNRLMAKSVDREIKKSVFYKDYIKSSRATSKLLLQIENGEALPLEELKNALQRKRILKKKYREECSELITKRKEYNRLKEEGLDTLTQMLNITAD